MPSDNFLSQCSTAKLNSLLAACDNLDNSDEAETPLKLGITAQREAVQAEKDRRLADPNGPDFRPQFN